MTNPTDAELIRWAREITGTIGAADVDVDNCAIDDFDELAVALFRVWSDRNDRVGGWTFESCQSLGTWPRALYESGLDAIRAIYETGDLDG